MIGLNITAVLHAVCHRHFRAFPEPEERHHFVDVDRIDAACGEYQSCRVLKLSG